MKKLILALLLVNPMFARAVYSNWCQDGNQTILVAGIPSSTSTPVQRSYPSATITVYLSDGTTLATIYSDNASTPKSNPFACGTGGRYSFYANQGIYFVRTSGTGVAVPFTFPLFLAADTTSGGALTSLNGLTAAVQTFATGTSGSDFNIVSATSTHTFNFPNASASNRGLLTSANWTTFNAKQDALTFSLPLVNTANVVSINTPVTIPLGGTNATTQTAAFDNLSPLTTKGDLVVHNGTNNVRQPVGTNGYCLTANSAQTTGLQWLNCLSTLPVTVPNGGTGATTLTGIVQGSGTSPFTATAGTAAFQALRYKANQTTPTYEFAAPAWTVSTDYNWTQSPTGTLTATVGATATLTPCPSGVNGADPTHYLYIAAVGTPEAVLITGGTCTSGATTGTVTFTSANNHSAGWTLASATSGLQEAVCALSTVSNEVIVPNGTTTLNANVSFCGKTSAVIRIEPGVTLSGSGALPSITASGAYIDNRRAGAVTLQNKGTNITSGTTIAPVAGITHVTGTTTTTTITVPSGLSTGCIVLIADAAWPVNTGGNIAAAATFVAASAHLFCYDGTSWYF